MMGWLLALGILGQVVQPAPGFPKPIVLPAQVYAVEAGPLPAGALPIYSTPDVAQAAADFAVFVAQVARMDLELTEGFAVDTARVLLSPKWSTITEFDKFQDPLSARSPAFGLGLLWASPDVTAEEFQSYVDKALVRERRFTKKVKVVPR